MTVVRVYTKPNCKQCDLTKNLLKSEGVSFVEEDIQEEGNLAAAKSMGMLSAPVVVAGLSGDDMWSGFRPDRIKALAARIGKKA